MAKLNAESSIVILTGAGISAESGLKTFRDSNGLWEGNRLEEVATPEAFTANPDQVHRFYNQRRAQLSEVAPNLAHMALAGLEKKFTQFLLVTQNVDDLHQRAGSLNVIQMHGSLLHKKCSHCHQIQSMKPDDFLAVSDVCQRCGKAGFMRPDIVWFGEQPHCLEQIYGALRSCDLFVSIGTSGSVYPAAGFVELARQNNALTVELNLVPSDVSFMFDEAHYGAATAVVPPYCRKLCAYGK